MNKMRTLLLAVLILSVGLSEIHAVGNLLASEQILLTSIDVRGGGHGNGGHKVPKKCLEVALSGDVLFLYGQFGNAQLIIKNSAMEIYTPFRRRGKCGVAQSAQWRVRASDL